MPYKTYDLPAGAPRNVKTAYAALQALGAPTYGHLAGEHGCRFIIGAELRDSADRYFCDYYNEELRETWHPEDKDKPVGTRRVLNAFGIDTRVHDILHKNGLYAEWINPGQVGVYDN